MLVELLPALVIPAIVGLFILLKHRHNRYARMLGWFTFKPVITTPFWLALIAIPPLGVLPGATLTIVLVLRFKDLFKQLGKIGYLLLMLDAIRWINSGLILPYARSELSFVVAAVTPAAFALLALLLLYAPDTKVNWVQNTAWESRPNTPKTAGLMWVFVTVLALALGFQASNIVGRDPTFGDLAVGAVFGICLGAGQWLVLRKYLRHSHWWIGVTALGATTGMLASRAFATFTLSSQFFVTIIGSVAFGLFMGTSIGVAQWILLRQYIKHSRVWVWANIIGWTLQAMILAVVRVSNGVSFLISGTIIGICTAVALGRVMRAASQPREQSAPTTLSALAVDSSKPSSPSQPSALAPLATHKVLFPVMLVVGGLLIVFLCGILPALTRQGYFEKWQPLTKVPADTAEILRTAGNGIYVQTGSGATFHCVSSANTEPCVQVEKVPSGSPMAPCQSSGPEYSPFTDQPDGVVLCIQEFFLHFPGGRTVYAIDQNYQAWLWHSGDNLTSMLLNIWIVLLVIIVVIAGAVIWKKAQAQAPLPPTE